MDKQRQRGLLKDSSQTVTCLGRTFASDAERRDYFLQQLRERLQDPAFLSTPGFPIGNIDRILAISDPPYYTACPNPFIGDFLECFRQATATSGYEREPFTSDVSEGKSDPIYNAHSYHTKVPHKAIMRYILHYTEPGDIVFDGFSGTGMTGVAAGLCANLAAVESLGYTVKGNGSVWDGDNQISRLGVRRAVLNDLSPAASFIAYNYNVPVHIDAFQAAARRLLEAFENKYGWMYTTKHANGRKTGRINYVVWSDVFLCNHCQKEVVFWTEAVEEGEVKDDITCPHCGGEVTKRSLDRLTHTIIDPVLRKPVQKAVRRPVLINYTFDGERYEKEPDKDDMAVLRRVEDEPIPGWYPTRRIDTDIDLWYERDYRSLGIFSVDSFFEKRALIMVSFFYQEIARQEGRLGGFLWFWFQSVLMGFSLLNRYLKNAFSQVNRLLSGTLYVGAMHSEVSPWYALEGKIGRLKTFRFIQRESAIVGTSSTAALAVPDNSIDYIFTDPPFGSNIIYSDLSLLWEAWLGLSTNTAQESVVHRRKKTNAFTLEQYTAIMTTCFQEMHRVLKPGRWITVEFHNSKNSVWNSIQEALLHAGFVVADVRTLDKQVGTFKQVTTAGAVKQDLVISAYKPSNELEERFSLSAGSIEGMWGFVRTHLKQLPVLVSSDGKGEIVAERQDYLLFDRMVAFHVQRGISVPMSAAEFYSGLRQYFPEREGMFFLPEQVAQYDKKRLDVSELVQLELFVSDESTAIQWLKRQLAKKPQTFSEIQPQFMKEIAGWEKREKRLELLEILTQNFVCYDGEGEVPGPIHSYLSSNHKELRNLPKDSPELVAKAKNRWYVPDPKKEADLERVRHRALMKEFTEYREAKGKLKVVRSEALRAGFKECWQNHEYSTIVQMAKRVQEEIIQEDPALLMYYDNALMRTEG